jgi:hypothetical protein
MALAAITENLIRFPARSAACVWLLRDGPAWLVLAGEHGWLFGSSLSAMADATWLSQNLKLPVRVLP